MLRCPSEYLQMVRDGDFGSRGRLIVAGGDYTISIGGGQPDTVRPALRDTSTSMARLPCRNKGGALRLIPIKAIHSRGLRSGDRLLARHR